MALRHFLHRIPVRFERDVTFDIYLRQLEGSQSSGVNDQTNAVARSLSWTCANILLLGVLLSCGHAFAGGVTDKISDHATTAAVVGRWDCDRGYRETNGSCTAIELPANAYATGSIVGAGWVCRRGYTNRGESCVAIAVPVNGYLSAGRGDAWKCARGFRKTGESCIAINVPENGYLSTSSYGSGWECDRGYRAVDDTCFAFLIPANAHINYAGTDWACDRPYRKSHDTCELH